MFTIVVVVSIPFLSISMSMNLDNIIGIETLPPRSIQLEDDGVRGVYTQQSTRNIHPIDGASEVRFAPKFSHVLHPTIVGVRRHMNLVISPIGLSPAFFDEDWKYGDQVITWAFDHRVVVHPYILPTFNNRDYSNPFAGPLPACTVNP